MVEEKQESLVRKVIELFQSREGFTLTPHEVTKTLEEDPKKVTLLMYILESPQIRILYSAWDRSEIYALNPECLWKITLKELDNEKKLIKLTSQYKS